MSWRMMTPGIPTSALLLALRNLFVVCSALLVIVVMTAPGNWWQTPDQKAQAHFDAGEYVRAAQGFSSAERRGIALFRAGEFKAAASEFARSNSAEGHFNHGTALIMAGQYDAAIVAFDQALKLRPGWTDALGNQEIARLRADRIRRVGGDMTGGMLGADDIVFDSQQGGSGGGQEQVQGGEELSDQALQALWLRRIQTRPRDFLRVKFAFQLTAQRVTGEQP